MLGGHLARACRKLTTQRTGLPRHARCMGTFVLTRTAVLERLSRFVPKEHRDYAVLHLCP